MSERRDCCQRGRWAGSRSRSDEQARDGVDFEALVQASLGGRLGERRDQAGGGGEEDAIAALDGLEAEPDGQVRLAEASGPRKTTFSPCWMKRTLLSVWICFLSSEGWS